MASTSVVSESKTAPPIELSHLLAMVLTVLLTVGSVAGLLVYLVKSGKLVLIPAASVAAASATKQDAAMVKTHEVVLEPMLVNLSDADGYSYLRIGVTLQIVDPAKGDKGAKADQDAGAAEASAPMRDTMLDVLGREQAADLLVSDGKSRLKAELKKALLERNPELKLSEIYFTEFLVQR